MLEYMRAARSSQKPAVDNLCYYFRMEIPLRGKQARGVAFMGLVLNAPPQEVARAQMATGGPMTLSAALNRKWEKPSKYGNVKTEYNGRKYDSKHEANTAAELELLRHAKGKEQVVDIKYQVRFPLEVKKQKICVYIADFVVTYADKRVEVIDAKGVLTDVYKLKKKLMRACLGIEIREI